MDDSIITVKEASGLSVPLFILFNENGEGYGSFPADSIMLIHVNRMKEPLMRASAYLNIYERLLDGGVARPERLLRIYARNLREEQEEQIVARMTRQFRNLYWQFILPHQRELLCTDAESDIWNALQHSKSVMKKRTLFQTFMSIAISRKGIEKLFEIWKTGKVSEGLILSEDDFISLATQLTIARHPEAAMVVHQQLNKIRDGDRKMRFNYLLPALSDNINVRDSFFTSLSKRENRKREVWVSAALSLLHHPLRASQSEKYLPKCLELMEEIQMTGGVFFPTDWLRSSLGSYQSKSAGKIVRSFLAEHPQYNSNLKRKILQESDDLFRAEKIINQE